MATIDNEESIKQLIRNNGHYSDDPAVLHIVEYTNLAGKRCWGIIYDNEAYRLLDYLVLNNAELIWTRKD